MTTRSTKERPIIFSPPMVQAILDGRKTVTRRAVKNVEYFGCLTGDCPHDRSADCERSLAVDCPYGRPGDRLWVREKWARLGSGSVVYGTDLIAPPRWRSPIHMPRHLSRINLEIVGVEVQRLHEITEADAVREGWIALKWDDDETVTARYQFLRAWDGLNAGRGFPWSSNPFVWCVWFERVGSQ